MSKELPVVGEQSTGMESLENALESVRSAFKRVCKERDRAIASSKEENDLLQRISALEVNCRTLERSTEVVEEPGYKASFNPDGEVANRMKQSLKNSGGSVSEVIDGVARNKSRSDVLGDELAGD